MKLPSKIFLIGMPGSGKSTIGKALATSLNYPFLDIDSEIEQKEKVSINTLFSTKGEEYFRKAETQLLSKVCDTEGNLIIATGGGTPCYYNGLEMMKSFGVTLFIDVPLKTLIKRLKLSANRPLLENNMEKALQLLYDNRIAIYSKSALLIKNNKTPINLLIKQIIKALESKT